MWNAPQGDTGVLGQAARGEQGSRGVHSDAGDDVSVGGKFAHDLFGLHIPYVDAVVFAATDDAGMCAVQHKEARTGILGILVGRVGLDDARIGNVPKAHHMIETGCEKVQR